MSKNPAFKLKRAKPNLRVSIAVPNDTELISPATSASSSLSSTTSSDAKLPSDSKPKPLTDKDIYIALSNAIHEGNTDYVIAFADLLPTNYKPNEGSDYSLLHQAAYEGKPDIIKLLVEIGNDPNLKNMRGDTPLHIAADLPDKGIRSTVVKTLIDRDADAYIKNNSGHTPSDFSQEAKQIYEAHIFRKLAEELSRDSPTPTGSHRSPSPTPRVQTPKGKLTYQPKRGQGI